MKNSAISAMNRRRFLGLTGKCAGLTAMSTMGALVNLGVTKSALAAVGPFNDYKAMVCVFFLGGMDSFNLLVPDSSDSTAYADYLSVRGGLPSNGGLALGVGEMLPLLDQNSGRTFAVPSNMSPLAELYDQGNLAFLANVGTLVEPTSYDQYKARANLPLGLFSHSDGQRAWQTAYPQTRAQISGWAGRVADILSDSVNGNPAVSMNIAMDSTNILQTGNLTSPYIISSNGATELNGYFGSGARDRILQRATDGLLPQVYGDLLEATYATMSLTAIDGAIQYNDATENISLNTIFPSSSFGRKMERIARSIGAQATLGQDRQIFYVGVGGWDYHSEILNAGDSRLTDVAVTLKAFYEALAELQMTDNVTTFTVSDFARTLSSNGNGSDHAWGANMMVMGGGVRGAAVYGHYPQSLLNPLGPDGGQLDVGRGRLIPTTSVDEYCAELAMWLGIPNDANLEQILPNIRNFFPAGGTSGPLGFMA